MADYTYTEGDIMGIMFTGYKIATMDIKSMLEGIVKSRSPPKSKAPPCRLFILREAIEPPEPLDFVYDIYSSQTILREPDTVERARAKSNLYRYFEFILVSDEGYSLRTKESVLGGARLSDFLYASLCPEAKVFRPKDMERDIKDKQKIIKAAITRYKEECHILT